MKFYQVDVTPILTLSKHNAVCNILTVDGVTMMFDCGWNETFSDDIADIYRQEIAFKVDYIFLSNNSINYIGGLPFLLKDENFKETKVYSTTPVSKLGFYTIVDAFISKIELSSNFQSFTDSEISSCFLNINEVKFKENIKLPQDILITPLPSGFSLGGCCWKINYKLHSVVYAPQFSINFKYICDPFPYESIKGANLFITDIKSNPKIPVVRTVIENEFKRNILEELEKQKSIFIPTDTANLNLEILIRLEKILDEFYMNRREGVYSNARDTKGDSKGDLKGETKKELPYKVLVCGYTSYEVVESIKSLIEFLGTSISQQFYSYNENPFNLQYVQCVKDVKEYHECKKNNNVIVLASFESLDVGIAYKLLPDILTDANYKVFLVSKSYKNSLLRNILKKLKSGVKYFHYEDIKRIIDANSNTQRESNLNILDRERLEHMDEALENPSILVENPSNNTPNFVPANQQTVHVHHKSTQDHDLSIKKKLFAKSPFLMFSYHRKRKLNEYGIELTEKEIKLMKSVSEEKSDVFESSFKAFLYTNNKTPEHLKNEMRLKIKRHDLFQKAHYEKKTTPFLIQAKFLFFDLFEKNGIDAISKEIIISEIRPKDEIIFLGGEFDVNDLVDIEKQTALKIFNKLTKICKVKVVNCNQSESISFKDNLLNLKYDSTVLNTIPSLFVQGYGKVYDLKNTFLKVKTKRQEIKEISIVEAGEKLEAEIAPIKLENEGEKENLDCFYTKADMKLLNLKREISKLLNEDFFIRGNYITNAAHDFKLFLKQKELILEGSLNNTYLKIRNCIYSNFINLDEL